MRKLMLVVLWIAAVVGILAGGGLTYARFFGPDAKEISEADAMVSTWRKNLKDLDAEGEKELAHYEAQVLTGRVYGWGGTAVAILSLGLLIVVLAKKGGVPVLAGLSLVTAIVLVVAAPGKEKSGILILAIPAAVASLCGVGADRARRMPAPQPG